MLLAPELLTVSGDISFRLSTVERLTWAFLVIIDDPAQKLVAVSIAADGTLVSQILFNASMSAVADCQ